jgi:tetratricopeptide (TPR) repeat protein
MRVAELDQKADEMGMKLIEFLETKGAEAFLSEPDALKKVLGITDEDIKELEHESYSYCEHKEWANAVKVLGYLMLFSPQNTLYHLRLGTVLMQLGNFEDAIKIFSVASSLRPHDPSPLLYIGNCFLKLNDDENAIKAFDDCIEIATKSPFLDKDNEEIQALALEGKNAILKV